MLRLIFDCGGDSSGTCLGAAYPYRTAAFWKKASMAEDLHLLGFGNLNEIANACIYLLSDAQEQDGEAYLDLFHGIHNHA